MPYSNIGIPYVPTEGFSGTAGTHYDSNFCEGAIAVNANETYVIILDTAQSEAWIHFRNAADPSNDLSRDGTIAMLLDDSGTPIVYVYFNNNSGGFYLCVGDWGNTGLDTLIGVLTYDSNDGIVTYDIHVKIDSVSGVPDIYENRTVS